MKDIFTIGEIAKLFDLNIRTLRFYDDIGLVRPEFTDSNTKYRYYSIKQFELLNTIKYLRALDMPLEKIKDFFEYRDVDKLLQLLQEQQSKIDARKRELDFIEKKINARILQIQNAKETVYEKIQEVHLPERKVIYLRKNIPMEEDLEYSIRELEREYNLEPMMFLGKVGVSIAKENLKQHDFSNYSSIFVFLEEETDALEKATKTIPEADFLVIRFQGTHVTSKKYYKQLLKEMKENGYEILGSSVEITLIDSGMTSNAKKFVTEIQIPIKKGLTL